MDPLDLLHNLESQRPIRTPTGAWDVALWIDYTDLSLGQTAIAHHIEHLATTTAIPICQSPIELLSTPAYTLVVVGHNTCSANPGVLRSLIGLGQALTNHWLLLNICANKKIRIDTRTLMQETALHGVTFFPELIDIADVAHVFAEFIDLGNHDPTLLPADAHSRAVAHVLATKQ